MPQSALSKSSSPHPPPQPPSPPTPPEQTPSPALPSFGSHPKPPSPSLSRQASQKLVTSDADRCLLRDASLLALSKPDAAGLLDRRSNISGWYRYWFSLHGSQLLYFERGQSNRRGLLIGTINLFRHKLVIVNSIKRRREFEITDMAGKLHLLRTESDAELHWWVQLLEHARKKIPPAHPIAHVPTASKASPTPTSLPNTVVDTHIRVDHVMCVVHGIGVDEETLASNIQLLQESYADIMAKVFPDLDFGIELLVVHWRDALTSLGIHRKLRAVVPRAPFLEQPNANPLKHIMEYRVVDYIYYTYPRYRRHMLREICRQLNEAVQSFHARRPDYKGKISVMGHSLGAALCYDLLSKRVHDDQTLLEAEGMWLEFNVDNLFCLGSPLGTLLALDPTIGGTTNEMFSLPFHIFNVFKYHDPIATRVEPLRDIRWADVPPITVPCWMNMGLRESTAQWFGSLWAGQKRKDSDTEQAVAKASAGTKDRDDEESLRRLGSFVADSDVTDGTRADVAAKVGDINERLGERKRLFVEPTDKAAKGDGGDANVDRSKGSPDTKDKSDDNSQWVGLGAASAIMDDMSMRFDYALQVSSTMEEMSTSWSAIKSHAEYWGNRDAMLLMVSRMVKSTYSITDDADESEHDLNTTTRIVDRDILAKGAVFDADIATNGTMKEGWTRDRRVDRRVDLEQSVALVVERIVEEAAAMHELVRQHPDVRVRHSGGVAGQSPVLRRPVTMQERAPSWTSYLGVGWFGGEGGEKTKP